MSWHLGVHNVRVSVQLWQLPITSCKFLLGFWTRGLTGLNLLCLETNYFNCIFKKNVQLTYFVFKNETNARTTATKANEADLGNS